MLITLWSIFLYTSNPETPEKHAPHQPGFCWWNFVLPMKENTFEKSFDLRCAIVHDEFEKHDKKISQRMAGISISHSWNPKQPFINDCFNWMIPNLYIGNGCLTKHQFFNGCLGLQVCFKTRTRRTHPINFFKVWELFEKDMRRLMAGWSICFLFKWAMKKKGI